VNSVTRLPRPSGGEPRASVNRRRFLCAAGGATLAFGPAVPRGSLTADWSLTAGQRLMVLQVARAGAVFPIRFPDFGEPGPATARATAARRRRAASRTSPGRLALARAGADTMIAHGLLNQPRARLLDGIGQLTGTAQAQPGLTAAVALAIATVSRHFDPASDDAALIWTDGLRRVHQRGLLAGREV
jgi:hypothetical protein